MDNQKEIEELKKQVEELKGQIKEGTTNTDKKEEVKKSINIEEKEEYSWKAPVRTFKPADKQKIGTIVLVVLLLVFILILLHNEEILITLIILIGIVKIAISVVPPKEATHKITNKGIFSYSKLYLWEDLTTFWFATKDNEYALYINTKIAYPSKLFFVVPQSNIKNVLSALEKYLKYQDFRQTQGYISKISDGLYIKYEDAKKL